MACSDAGPPKGALNSWSLFSEPLPAHRAFAFCTCCWPYVDMLLRMLSPLFGPSLSPLSISTTRPQLSSETPQGLRKSMGVGVNKTWVQNLILLPVYNALNRGLSPGLLGRAPWRETWVQCAQDMPAVPSLRAGCWTPGRMLPWNPLPKEDAVARELG